jgi:hypothetical protein
MYSVLKTARSYTSKATMVRVRQQPDGNTEDGLARLFSFLLSPSSVSVVNNFISSRCGLQGGEMFNKLTLELSLAGLNLSKT